MLTATHDWLHLFDGERAPEVMRALPEILQTRRWFGGKARRIEETRILDTILVPSNSTSVFLLIRVEYKDAGVDTYALPVAAAFDEEAQRIRRESSGAIIVPL